MGLASPSPCCLLCPQIPANPNQKAKPALGSLDRPELLEERCSGCHFDHKIKAIVLVGAETPLVAAAALSVSESTAVAREGFFGGWQNAPPWGALGSLGRPLISRGAAVGGFLLPALLSGFRGPALCQAQDSCSLRTAASTSHAFSLRYWWQFSVCHQGSVVY